MVPTYSKNYKQWGKKKDLVLNNIPELAHKSAENIVNIVNNHFGIICQTYPPVDKNVANKDSLSDLDLKLISERDTYNLIKKFSKKALGPGDFPKRILNEFATELALPYMDIINCALKTGTFLDAYKISEIIATPKVLPPKELKDLRPSQKPRWVEKS